ncbi:dual specificity protein phosphatase family protein [Bacteriovoracaceae bacterium]|nr:dual specificity protein phosphatase family protein [Bacteriovoracaceae bacterium]
MKKMNSSVGRLIVVFMLINLAIPTQGFSSEHKSNYIKDYVTSFFKLRKSKSSAPKEIVLKTKNTGVFDINPDTVGACSEITPRIFITSAHTASDLKKLQAKKIGLIVNAASSKCESPFGDKMKYLNLELDDYEDQSILKEIISTSENIRKFLKKNRRKNVLVHCFAGMSRSCTLVIGHLMITEGLRLDVALEKVQNGRNVCEPNSGFMNQLRELEQNLVDSNIIKK